MGTGFGREVVRASLTVDVVCGLLQRLRSQWLLCWRDGGSDGDRRIGDRGTRKVCIAYDFALVVHSGGVEEEGKERMCMGWTCDGFLFLSNQFYQR